MDFSFLEAPTLDVQFSPLGARSAGFAVTDLPGVLSILQARLKDSGRHRSRPLLLGRCIRPQRRPAATGGNTPLPGLRQRQAGSRGTQVPDVQ